MRKIRNFRFILYQLLRPFSYLKIVHADKWIYDWLVPAILTAFTMIFCCVFVPVGDIAGSLGLVSSLVDFIGSLPGFFIAALAAVATFNKHDIDELMANPPKIEIIHHGNPLMVEMTRRRFLCVLFSYLTAISILLAVVGKFSLFIEVSSTYKPLIIWLGFFGFLFFMWQMITATILGLYYLGERLHTPQ